MKIRSYQPQDRPQIERICLDTGLRGHLDELFADHDLFLQLWLAPYLDYEPENTLVAEQDGQVVGYLVSTFSPAFDRHAGLIALRVAARMLGRFLLGRYRHHPPSVRFIKWFWLRALWEMPRRPRRSSHLHFNIASGHRGSWFNAGPAGKLMARYEDMVAQRGLANYHAVLFTSPRRRTENLYERVGFAVYDRRPCSLFKGDEVYLTTIVKETRGLGLNAEAIQEAFTQ